MSIVRSEGLSQSLTAMKGHPYNFLTYRMYNIHYFLSKTDKNMVKWHLKNSTQCLAEVPATLHIIFPFLAFFSVCIYKLIDNVHSEGHQNIREPFRTDKDYVLTRYYIIFLFG